MRYAIIIFLTGCALEGNASHEMFLHEYEAVAEVTAPVHSLGSIKIRLVSWERLQSICGKPCSGVTQERGLPHNHMIHMTEPPEDRCKRVTTEHGSYQYSRTVIHELLHAQHFEHGEEMDLAEQEAWEIYHAKHCT